jgi:hypothetical protein
MDSDWIKRLRERAFELWEEEGRPDGRHEDHWRRAEAELERMLLQHAKQVAIQAHDGQSDKLGSPYIRHCERVAAAVSTNDEKVVAYLHDVVEKGAGWTLDRLKEDGFPSRIVEAVDALTGRPNEDDREFVERAWSNPLARPVKESDLRDNLQQAERGSEETAKYQQGLETFRELQSKVD